MKGTLRFYANVYSIKLSKVSKVHFVRFYNKVSLDNISKLTSTVRISYICYKNYAQKVNLKQLQRLIFNTLLNIY